MADTILADMQISDATDRCVVNAPVEKVDLATWLFKLSEDEYRRCCPPDHISCGIALTDEGKPTVLNVEMIGHALMIHRYVVEITTPTFFKLVSLSEAFTPNGRTRVQVVKTLNVKKINESTCDLVSSTMVHPTAEFMDFIAQHKIKFKDAAAARQHVEGEHNRRETPLIAVSIEKLVGQANPLSRSMGAI
jgi:hypothetical protein